MSAAPPLPDGWGSVPLGDLVHELANGVSPSKGGDVEGRVLTLSAITRGAFDPTQAKDARFARPPGPDKMVKEGTFLICRGNGNLGLVGAGVVASATRPALIFPDTMIAATLRLDRVDPCYLERVWSRDQIRAQITSAARTTSGGIHKVNQQTVGAIKVPLPPLPEQCRIAAILDKADAIRRKRQETIRLTEEFLRSTFLDMFGDPVTNPKGWPTVRLGEVADFVGGGTPSRAVPAYFDGYICWATSKDMKGEVLTDTQEHITEEAVENSATKQVPRGTLLVVVKSKILMHRLPVLLTAVPACFSQDIKAILLSAGFPPRYVARHLRVGQRALLDLARGVNTEGLTLDHLRNYRLMAPEQAMLAKFEKVEALQEAASVKLDRSLAAADDLFGAVTARAFAGAL